MGCWNQTCGITQIHIRDNEEVMIVALSATLRDSLCYTTPFFTPFPIPFYGKYNDYGAADECHGVGLSLVLEQIRKNLVEIEQGDNEYHDVPVYADGFNEGMFWEAIHEQRLFVRSYGGTKSEVGMVMIKQSVFDHLAENYKFSTYDYNSKTGRSAYYHYSLADMLAGVPEVVDAIIDGPGKLMEGVGAMNDQQKAALRRLAMRIDPISNAARGLLEDAAGEEISMKNANRAAMWLKYSDSHLQYGGGGFGQVAINNAVVNCIERGERDEAIELLREHLKLLFVDSLLMNTRRFWSPQAGAGSQSSSHDGYRAIIAAMTHVLDEEVAERAAWEASDD